MDTTLTTIIVALGGGLAGTAITAAVSVMTHSQDRHDQEDQRRREQTIRQDEAWRSTQVEEAKVTIDNWTSLLTGMKESIGVLRSELVAVRAQAAEDEARRASEISELRRRLGVAERRAEHCETVEVPRLRQEVDDLKQSQDGLAAVIKNLEGRVGRKGRSPSVEET